MNKSSDIGVRMALRHGGNGPRRIAVGFAAVVGAVGAVSAGAGPAAAGPVSVTLGYTCAFPLIGAEPVSIRVTADLPASVAVGRPTPAFDVGTTATLQGPVVLRALGLLGAKTIGGTADAAISVAAPQGVLGVTVPFDLVRTGIPASGPIAVPATGAVPPLTFSRPGVAKVTVGDVTLRLALRNGSGAPTPLGDVTLACRLNAGQDGLLGSVEITVAAGPTTPPGPTGGSTSSGAPLPGSGNTGPTASAPFGSADSSATASKAWNAAGGAGGVPGAPRTASGMAGALADGLNGPLAPGTSSSATGIVMGAADGVRTVTPAPAGIDTLDAAPPTGPNAVELLLVAAGIISIGTGAFRLAARLKRGDTDGRT